MLELDNIHAYYGESHVLHGVSLSVGKGEVVCLLGRNGAGKTTTILTIMGYLQPRARPHPLQRPRHRRAAALRRVAARVRLRAAGARDFPEPDGARKPDRLCPRRRQVGHGHWHRIFELFPNLHARERNLGFQLSGGEQQMLSIARALMLNPDAACCSTSRPRGLRR